MREQAILSNSAFKVIFLFLFVPVISIFILSFYNENGDYFSGISVIIKDEIKDQIFVIVMRSIVVCSISTIISYVISYFLFFHLNENSVNIILLLIALPFLIVESVRIFSWKYIFSENGILNSTLSLLTTQAVTFFNGSNIFNVYFVMIIACIPFGIFIDTYYFRSIPSIYWKAASDLKIKRFTRFLSIDFPLSKVCVLINFTLVFFVSFSLSSEVNFLGGDTKISVRNLISGLLSASNFQAVFMIGSFLILTIVFIVSIFHLYSKIFHENS